jgi:hypothetical protein
MVQTRDRVSARGGSAMSKSVILVAKALGKALQWLLSALVRPAQAGLRTPTRRGWEALRSLVHAAQSAVPRWAHRPAYFVLTVLAGVLLSVLRQIDSALRQMHLPGGPGGGALGFPLRLGSAFTDGAAAAKAQRTAWQHYLEAVSGTRVLAAPQTLVRHLVLIDTAFVVVYGVLLAAVLVGLGTANNALTDRLFVPARRRLLIAAGFSLVLLIVVDITENVLLLLTFGRIGPTMAGADVAATIGPMVTGLKFLIAVMIAIPMVLTAIAVVAESAPVRRAMLSARGVLIILALVVTVLLVFGLGKNQTDDVVRAWTVDQGLLVLITGVTAALVIIGVTAYLTGSALDHPAPDTGDDPQPLVLGGGVILLVVGTVMHVLGLGWGLLVPGALLVLLWLVGLPLTGLQAASRTGPPATDPAIAAAGRTLAVTLGATLLAVLVWVIARASAFDLFVRAGTPRWGWAALIVGIALALVVAGAVLVSLQGITQRTGWRAITAVALVLGAATMVPGWQITLPACGGSIAVVLISVTLLVGIIGWLVGGVRRGPVGSYRLVPAVRALGFRRFPVVLFVLMWLVAVSVIDRGGYHDIRRFETGNATPPQTLEQAFGSWRRAGAPSAPRQARPLVIVATQGGGMRAAVWTALVMECLFGPGPVRTDAGCAGGTGALDRASAQAAVRDRPLPVFLASGSSGGSVGLAAWSARRIDLASGGGAAAGTPAVVEDGLRMDFLAPNLARWFVGDVSYAFLGHGGQDRAAILEQAWERPWGDTPGTGVARGLRATYQQSTAGNRWQIPVLAFNGVGVEDGCRFLASPVDFEITRAGQPSPTGPGGDLDTSHDADCRSALQPDDGTQAAALPVTGELVDYLCADQDVPLSTAAHLSARFPYISPTGRVERQTCADGHGLVEEHAVTFNADGGMFDNSGSLTALEAWRALAPLAAGDEADGAGCIVPIFVQIDNGVSDGDGGNGTDPKPSEVSAPLNVLLGEVGSRESYGRASAATAFVRPVSPGGREVTLNGQSLDRLWFHIALFGQPGPKPPLGWTLSDTTVSDMRAQLGVGPNRDQIRQVRDLLTGTLSCR